MNGLKKAGSFLLSLSMMLGMMAAESGAEGGTGTPSQPVYYMNFSPDSDGKFYDVPPGYSPRTEIKQIDNPTEIVFFPNHTNYGDKILDTSGSKIVSQQNTANYYTALSKGSAADDVNTGASGAVDDYCLKIMRIAGSGSDLNYASVTFPETFGGKNDLRGQKYRLEWDWKWQSYNENGGVFTPAYTLLPTGVDLFNFTIGGKTLKLRSRNSGDTATAGDGKTSAFVFVENTANDFGLTVANQINNKAGAMFENNTPGKWAHISIDFDFSAGTIDAVLECNNQTSTISTAITSDAGLNNFANGISKMEIRGFASTAYRAIFADNIKLNPIYDESAPSAAPANTAISRINNNAVLSWSPVSGADGYIIKTKGINETSYNAVNDIEVSSSAVSYALNNIPVGTQNTYAVAAVRGTEVSEPGNEVFYSPVISNDFNDPSANISLTYGYLKQAGSTDNAKTKGLSFYTDTAPNAQTAALNSAYGLIGGSNYGLKMSDEVTNVGINVYQPFTAQYGQTQISFDYLYGGESVNYDSSNTKIAQITSGGNSNVVVSLKPHSQGSGSAKLCYAVTNENAAAGVVPLSSTVMQSDTWYRITVNIDFIGRKVNVSAKSSTNLTDWTNYGSVINQPFYKVNATDAENSRTYIDGINFGTPGNYQNGTLKYRMIDNLMIDGYFAADTVRFDDTASGVRGSFYAANPNGFCFMAVYDGNKLVDLVMGEYAGLEGTAYKYTAETASGSDLVNGYKVKAFLWDGFNGIKPLDEKTVQGYIVQ